MTEVRSCPHCGTVLPPDAPAGLCPRCLFQQGLGSQGSPTTAHSSPFIPPTPAELGARLPQFEILELLGQGGMGAVYKARQPGLDRLVAVKILPPDAGRDPAFAERFAREARALARLSHPHIVAVHDFGQIGGWYHLVMEYVDGVNLRQTIQAGGLSAKDALAIVPQICDALQFAHEEGIVHRDIKPENILIDRRGRVKIADFGLAKLLGQGTADNLTATQQVMGTLRYMAPEQMAATRSVDHRADIYSLGVVFYELLTGELPLGRFAPPSQKVQVDVRLDEVVLRALENEPEKRYQHASEIKTDVEAIVTKEPASSEQLADHGLLPREEARLVQLLRINRIAAIRFYREVTGAGLAEAKEAVEALGRRHGIAPPPRQQLLQFALITLIIALGCGWAATTDWPEWVKIAVGLGSLLLYLLFLLAIWLGVRKDRVVKVKNATEAERPNVLARTAFVLFLVALAFIGVVVLSAFFPPLRGINPMGLLLLSGLLALLAMIFGFVTFSTPQGKVGGLGGLILCCAIGLFIVVVTPVSTDQQRGPPQPRMDVGEPVQVQPARE